MSEQQRGRITHRTFTEVMLRVAYKLVQVDLRQNPDKYREYPPAAIVGLCERLQGQFPEMKPFLHYYARNVAHGYKMSVLRDNPPDYTLRSIAKLKPRQRGR